MRPGTFGAGSPPHGPTLEVMTDSSATVPDVVAASSAELPAVGAFLLAASLSTFSWLAPLAGRAPRADERIALTRVAARQTARLDVLDELVAANGVPDVAEAASAYLPALAHIGSRTRPGDWWERITRAFVVEGMVRDLQNRVAQRLPEPWRGGFLEVSGPDAEEVIVRQLATALADDERLAHRLALWGRRVTGEVLGATRLLLAHGAAQAAGVTAEEDQRALMAALTGAHVQRMDRLGLAA